jgi:hypothetical protein
MLLNNEVPVMVKMANGETIMGKVVELKAVKEGTPFAKPTLVLEDVGTFQVGHHPKKPGEVVYSLVQWQTEVTYLAWDKVITFSVASALAQDYYRQVFQKVQVANINEIAAMEKGGAKKEVVIETP